MYELPEENDGKRLDTLLARFSNLELGLSDSYLEEDDFELIIEHFENDEKYQKVIEATELALQRFPHSATFYLMRAKAFIALGFFNDALNTLKISVLIDADNYSYYVLLIDAQLGLHLDDEAHKTFAEALVLFEGEEKVNMLFDMADVFDDYQEFEKVFDCMVEILKIDGNEEEALYKICFWTDYTGRNEESIRLHQQIIEEHPFNELAWFNLGAAYQGLKLHEKAIEAYEYAVAIDDKFDYAYRNMGDAFLRIRKYQKAIESLQKVLELSAPETVLYEAIGHCWFKLGNYSQARLSYRNALQLSPDDVQLLYKVATTYMQENSWKTAVKYLHKAALNNKVQPEVNLALGQCYMELEEFDESITFLGTVVRLRPRSTSGWVELLRCMHKAGYYEEGLEYAGFAMEQTEKRSMFQYFNALFLFEIGKFKEAALQLESAMIMSPKLIKRFIVMNPMMLQHAAIVDVIARYKKKKYM